MLSIFLVRIGFCNDVGSIFILHTNYDVTPEKNIKSQYR